MALILKPKNQVKRNYKRLVLNGVGGAGKSTAMGTVSKKPLVIDLDNRWPNVFVDKSDFGSFENTFLGVKQFLRNVLAEQKLENDWIVIDTATKLLGLIEEHTIQHDCMGSRDKYNAYGFGLKFAPMYLREILYTIDEIQAKFGVNVAFICHTKVKEHKNPLTESHHKNCLDLPDVVSENLKQWADYVGYVWMASEVVDKKAVGDLNRYISFTPSPLYEAKNSSPFALPERVVFDKEGVWAEVCFGDTQNLLHELDELVLKFNKERQKTILELIEKLGVRSFGKNKLNDFIESGKQELKKG